MIVCKLWWLLWLWLAVAGAPGSSTDAADQSAPANQQPNTHTASSSSDNRTPLQRLFDERAHQSTDPHRTRLTKSILRKAAGVYREPRYNWRSLHLDRTALITLVAANTPLNAHYSIFLQNFLCFAEHHHLKPLVYLMQHNNSNARNEAEHIRARGGYAHTYPDSLFWKTVATKWTPLRPGNGYGLYDADIPDFASYGSIVMLIPVLEALLLGYDVIFLDVDVALLHDPVPFLMRGSADMTMSMEPRGCQDYYSSEYPDFFDWERMEPNTGVMRVRASISGISLYIRFLEHIVEMNILNDQRAFIPRIISAQYDGSCHGSRYVSAADPGSERRPLPAVSFNTSASLGTFCFVDELLIQNGLIGVTCSARKHFRDEWLVQMSKHAIGSGSTFDGSAVRYPAVLHVNYVSSKVLELDTRGLWLVKGEEYLTAAAEGRGRLPGEQFCNPFNLSDTYYGKMNWESEMQGVLERRRHFKDIVQKGKLIKSAASTSVYYVDDQLVRHEIQDRETFDVKFGGNFDVVVTVPTVVLLDVVKGEPYPKPTPEEVQAVKQANAQNY